MLSVQGGLHVQECAISKGAAAILLKVFANEWAPHSDAAHGAAPGYIAANNTADLRAGSGGNAAILAGMPTNREGETNDLTSVYTFPFSPASDYVTGTLMTRDGGWMAR